MRDYALENGKVNISKLYSDKLSHEDYVKVHKNVVITCHDVFIKYYDGKNFGILLVNRKNLPAKDTFWPIGGRILRGMETLESLKKKVFEECSLKIKNITYLGAGRTYFETDPFGHGNGTDTLNIAYFAEGVGKIKLDKLHDEPTIITKKNYSNYSKNLHPYVKEYLDKSIKMI